MKGWRLLPCCVILACAAAAHGHVVYGAKTLHALASESDLVLRARIVKVDAGPTPSAEHPTTRRPAVEADVLEVLEGSFDRPRVRFVQHGHGVAQFDPGSETLLFLVRISRSRELDQLGHAGAYEWVSLQEHDDVYALDAGSRSPALEAIRAYGVSDAAKSTEARAEALRGATLVLLTSGDTRLAASAVRDLVLSPNLLLVTKADVPALETVLNDAGASMGVRVGLLAALERRGLVDAPALWLSLLADDVPTRDRVTAIRAAGMTNSGEVRARLTALMQGPDLHAAAAAANALGVPGNESAVKPLSAALLHASPTVRMAAIRGLGRIDSPQALQALERTASQHPDPATQRRARAEVRKRRGEDLLR
jgi:hypothetical protein